MVLRARERQPAQAKESLIRSVETVTAEAFPPATPDSSAARHRTVRFADVYRRKSAGRSVVVLRLGAVVDYRHDDGLPTAACGSA